MPSVNVAVASTSGVFIGTCVSDLFPRSLSLKLSAATALASGTALEFIALNETNIFRVGQKRICTPYMTVCKVISLLEIRPAIPVRVLAPKPKSTFKCPGPLTRYI